MGADYNDEDEDPRTRAAAWGVFLVILYTCTFWAASASLGSVNIATLARGAFWVSVGIGAVVYAGGTGAAAGIAASTVGFGALVAVAADNDS